MAIKVSIGDPLELERVQELLIENWREAGNDIEFILSDALDYYKRLKETTQNVLGAIVYEDEQIIGYCIATLTAYPFNHAVKACSVNGLYLMPDKRNGIAVSKLMEAVCTIAKDWEAQEILWHAPAGSAFNEALKARYKPLSNYYKEVL